MADRYEILGYFPEQRDDNRNLDPKEQRPDPVVVSTTDDKDEAERLRLAGGWVGEQGWVVVTGYRDTEKSSSAASGPIEKS